MESDVELETQTSPLPFAAPSVADLDVNDETLFGDNTEPTPVALTQTQRKAPLHGSTTDPGSEQAMCSIHRAHHMLTNPAIQNINAPASAEVIATKTFEFYKRNLNEHGFNTSVLRLHDLQWLLPTSGATQQQLSIFLALRDFPLIVPNGDLGRILDLELCTEMSPQTPHGIHFYIHSFELTRYQLKKVMEFLTEQDILLSQAVQWENTLVIHSHQAEPCTFTIRYIDKVSGPGRLKDRRIKDLATDKRQTGVLLEFVGAVEQLFPEVAAAVQVHRIKQASTDDGFGSDLIVEDTERVLVEFFEPRSLLNRVRGGHYVRFVPFSDDINLFKRLHTRYYSRFMADARHVATYNQMAATLVKHFDEIQAYANSNPSQTGTVRYPFTDRICEAARMSAEPMLYHGTAILAVLAKEITCEQYLEETAFFGSNARAGYLVHDFLSRFIRTEESNAGVLWSSLGFQPRHIAFATFWPWLWHSHTTLNAAIHFTRRYLSMVRPLVVATFGRQVTSIVRANLNNETSLPFGLGLSSVVGEITIQYHGLEGDEHSAFLAVPHIDPGFEKYVDFNLNQILLRFMDLTWQITLHLADEARKLLGQDYANGITRSRKAKCIEILRRINHLRASDPDTRAFMDNFRKVGNELHSGWKQLHHCSAFRDFRPIPNEDGPAGSSDDDDEDIKDSGDDDGD
jgi:hypothetical protein